MDPNAAQQNPQSTSPVQDKPAEVAPVTQPAPVTPEQPTQAPAASSVPTPSATPAPIGPAQPTQPTQPPAASTLPSSDPLPNVNPAPASATPPANSKPKTHPIQKLFLALIILLVLGVLGGGGYYVMSQKQTPKVAKVIPTVAPSPTPDPTAGWTTFTSSQSAFSLKAPATFLRTPLTSGDTIALEQPSASVSGSNKPLMPLSFMSAHYVTNIDGKTIQTCASNDVCYQQVLTVARGAATASQGKVQYQEVMSTILSKQVKGVAVYQPEVTSAKGIQSPAKVNFYFDISHNGNRFELTFSVDGNMATATAQKPTIDLILSTFQFLPQTISAGGLYTFAKYHMTVPTDWTVSSTKGASGEIVTVTKDAYKLIVSQAAFDGGACSYTDKPITTGIFQSFASYVEINDQSGTQYRRGKLAQSGYPGQDKYEICALSTKNNVFQEFTPFGRIDYLTPAGADATTLTAMDAILSTVKSQ